MQDFQLIINGQSHPGIRREIYSPYDGRPVGSVTFGDAAAVEAAIVTAQANEPNIVQLPIHRRVHILKEMARILECRRKEIAAVICHEAGKPIRYAEAEAARAVQTFTDAAEQCKYLEGEYVPIDAVDTGQGRYGLVRRFPVGALAAISPFNFPLNLAAHKVAPAIAAGCPVVLKPASQTPMSALLLGDIARTAGLPPGGLSVIPSSREAANQLTTDHRLKLLTFTGSAEVGWGMKARAGKKRVVLELGGNAAVIIGADVDLKKIVPNIVIGAFAYAGQICISVQRVLVMEPVFNAFLQHLVDATPTLAKVGDPTIPDVVVGPMIDQGNQERILSWLEEAKAVGARIRCGGEKQGRCITPTVITDTNPNLKIYAEEAFGPVVVVERVQSWPEAIERVNQSRFGLQCGVFTNDLHALWSCFEGIEVGGIIHNDCPTFRVDHMPYGGVKDSGFGREGTRYAIEEMTERRLLVLRP